MWDEKNVKKLSGRESTRKENMAKRKKLVRRDPPEGTER